MYSVPLRVGFKQSDDNRAGLIVAMCTGPGIYENDFPRSSDLISMKELNHFNISRLCWALRSVDEVATDGMKSRIQYEVVYPYPDHAL